MARSMVRDSKQWIWWKGGNKPTGKQTGGCGTRAHGYESCEASKFDI